MASPTPSKKGANWFSLMKRLNDSSEKVASTVHSITICGAVFFSLLISSCAPPTTYGIYSWDNSNARLVEKSVPNEAIVGFLDSVLTDADRIVVLSEESEVSTDNSMLAGIETQIIRGLLDANIKVLERDDDLIGRIISESSENYSVLSSEKSRHSEASASRVSGSSLGSARSNYGNGAGSIGSQSSYVAGGSGQVSYSVEYWSRLDSTSLMAATRILSYRVLECGVQKEVERNGSNYSSREVGRLARTVLDVKLIDSRTGEITFSNRFSGIERYRPERGEVLRGIDPKYRYYSFGNPVQNGNPDLQKVREEPEPKTSAAKPLRGIVAIALLTIAALVF